MRNLFCILLVLLSFLSCNNKKDRSLPLFNGISFTLEENESEVRKMPVIEDKFQAFVGNYSFQIPLFKCVKYRNCMIYIGLPYQTTLSEFINAPLTGEANILNTVVDDSLTYFYRTQEMNGVFYAEYVKSDNNNIIYILAETADRALSDSLFIFDKFSKRLQYVSQK